MKRLISFLCVAAFLSLAIVAFAESGDGGGLRKNIGQSGRRHRKRLRRMDKDGDGTISREERQIRRKGRRRERRKRRCMRFDKDGRATLSKDERKRMRKQFRKRHMMRRFDTDKDGKLSDTEKVAVRNARKAMLAKYDKDGDGKLSKKEKKARSRDIRTKCKAERKARREKFVEKFDKDGDGKLSKEEKKAAKEALNGFQHCRGRKGGGQGADGGEMGIPGGI